MLTFTPEERETLRAALVAAARADEHILGAAHIGSMAAGRVDRWSDIDLALALEAGSHRDEVVSLWTDRMYRQHRALAHLDVPRGSTLYRVFLLENTLQVDLSFWDVTEFGATGPAFGLIFGAANERPRSGIKPHELVGLGWVHALHVRSSLARGRLWQAEYMLSEMRDAVLKLACLRHGVPESEGRGWDDLPEELTAPWAAALVRSLHTQEIQRAFGVTMMALLDEVSHVDQELADRLRAPLRTVHTCAC